MAFLDDLPIAVIQMALWAAFPAYPDWAADVVYGMAFFMYGYVLFAQPSLTEVIGRHGWIALVIGMVSSLSCGRSRLAFLCVTANDDRRERH